MEISFVVLGDAVAQGRPRVAVRGKHATVYDPAKSRDYKQYVRLVASQHAPSEPLTGPLTVEISAYFFAPKSWSKKKRQMALNEVLLPTNKKDCDNIAKGVLDALNGIMYVDDGQVTTLIVHKRYSEKPRTEIVIKVCGEMERIL